MAIRENNVETLSSKFNVVLNLLNRRSTGNRLNISYEKTEFTIFSNREHKIIECFISFGPYSIQILNNSKFLGATIDNNLTFRSLANNVLSKNSDSAGLLYLLRNRLLPETRLSFFYSLISPHLSHNISFWGRANEFILKSLFTAQKRIVTSIN